MALAGPPRSHEIGSPSSVFSHQPLEAATRFLPVYRKGRFLEHPFASLSFREALSSGNPGTGALPLDRRPAPSIALPDPPAALEDL